MNTTLAPTSADAVASLQEDDYTANNTVHLRPEGMSDKQDLIIQHVAEYVVNSCNSAAYYQKIRQKTQYNVNFNFLHPEHLYYRYYAFLVESYEQWKRFPYAEGVGAAGIAASTLDTASEYENVGQNYSFYSGESANAGLSSAGGAPSLSVADKESGSGTNPSLPFSTVVENDEKTKPSSQNVVSTSLGEPPRTLLGMNRDDDEDEDEDEYELVEVNGVKQLVPRHR